MRTPTFTSTGLGHGTQDPEPFIRNLAFGILLRALRDLLVLSQSSSGSERENWNEEARQWVLSEETSPGSFHWVCEALSLSPRTLREKLRSLRCAERRRRKEFIEKLSRFQRHR